jgi:hypothetical protein
MFVWDGLSHYLRLTFRSYDKMVIKKELKPLYVLWLLFKDCPCTISRRRLTVDNLQLVNQVQLECLPQHCLRFMACVQNVIYIYII